MHKNGCLNRIGFAVIALLVWPMSSLAQGQVVVDSLQSPAWVERNSVRIPLMPGMELGAADKIRTGGLGKVLLRLEEGSDVKLGQNVEMNLEKLAPATGTPTSIFSTTLNVLQGAFRFTTSLIGKNRKRDIQVRVGTATIGIRGTDVWGKSTPDRDFVVLIEGVIELTRANSPAVTMDQPHTIFEAPEGEAAKAVTAVDMQQLGKWAKETELDKGKGVITKDGPYRVYLASFLNRQQAISAQQDFQYLGYAVELFSANVKGVDRIRLGIKGFSTYADANYFRKSALERFDIPDAWLSKS